MRNQAMQRKQRAGEALDVEKMLHADQTEAVPPGVFRLRDYIDDVDYFVGSSEHWIWSIGRRHSDGAIFAAEDGRYYQNPDFECLWLR